MTEAQKQKFIELVENGEFKYLKDKIFWVIKNNPEISTDEIQKFLGIKKNGTLGGRLAELQDAGLIKATGIKTSTSKWTAITDKNEKQEQIKERQKEKLNKHIDALLSSELTSKSKLSLVDAWCEINGLNENDLSVEQKRLIVKNYKK